MHRPNSIIRWAILVATVSVVASACGSTAPTGTPVAPGTPVASTAVAAPSSSASLAKAPQVALSVCADRFVTWDGTSSLDLTGAWSVDGYGIYFIRQIGSSVWWTGLSGLGEPTLRSGIDWTNVFKGEIKGVTVTGTYVDVPKGGSDLSGPVKLELRQTARGGASLVRTNPDSETDFLGKVFTPCTPG